MIRQIGILLFFTCMVLLAFSFAGAVHPLGDSLSVFRYLIANGVMIGVVLAVRQWRRVVAVVALLLGIFIEPLTLGISPLFATPGGRYSLYQKNLLFNNREAATVLADIRERSPDFITLQELSRHNRMVYTSLEADYPGTLRCGQNRTNAIAVLARFPPTGTAPVCLAQDGLAAIEVQTPDGPVWVAVLHMRWPWPKAQPSNLEIVVPALRALPGPVVIAGDFNAVPWSHAMSLIRHAGRTERVGPVIRTLVGISPFLRLPIDHILVPGGQGTLVARPELGSDHLGLFARFDL